MKLIILKTKIRRPLCTQKSVVLFCSPVKHIKKLLENPLALKKLLSRKVSLYVSPKTEGSMTVEAALIVPFFMMIILSILSFIEIIQLQTGITMGLREAGIPMSVYSYAYDYVREGGETDMSGLLPNLTLSYGYAGYKVREYLGKEYLENSPLKYGASSIQYYKSSIMEKGDVIDLVATYVVEPDFNIALLPDINMVSRYYGRAWTGYEVGEDVLENSQDVNVYITPDGSVYHKSRFCTHLQLTIMSCSYEQLDEKRNEDGSKYSACMICIGNEDKGKVYITQDGNRYHRSIKCSGLKRTIDVVPLSQVGSRKECSRCGGSQ